MEVAKRKCHSSIFYHSTMISILMGIMISSNQKSCKVKNISSTTGPNIMVLLGDSITRKVSVDYSVSCFNPRIFKQVIF